MGGSTRIARAKKVISCINAICIATRQSCAKALRTS